MPQYAIMRFAKQKGGAGALEAHHERTKEKYASNPDIDTSRSKENFHIVAPSTSYKRETDRRIKAVGCRTRKDSVRFVDTLVTASPEFFQGKKREEVQSFFQYAADFLSRKIGEGNIFSAVVHMDEKTPHMHLCFTPITEDGRLSAKDIIGNRVQLTKWQDNFFSHMVKAFPDLERGEAASKTGRQHIPTRVFKQAVRLTKQAEKIQETLESINSFNAGRKREEAIALLQRFLPAMEDYATLLKRYKGEFERQERDNAALAQRLEQSKPSITEHLEAERFKKDYERLRRIVDAIPADIRKEVEAALRSHKNRDKGGR
jgi:hypothetical protein